MAGETIITVVGNLTADPELRYTQGGQAVLNVRLATDESYVNKDGERQDRTEWHSVIIWGKRGEGLNKVLSKGKQIFACPLPSAKRPAAVPGRADFYLGSTELPIRYSSTARAH